MWDHIRLRLIIITTPPKYKKSTKWKWLYEYTCEMVFASTAVAPHSYLYAVLPTYLHM